jgi:hypothetical protein
MMPPSVAGRPHSLVNAIVERLEAEFYAARTSGFIPNSDGDGEHIFIKIMGRRED